MYYNLTTHQAVLISLVLEVLDTAQTFELSIDHDSQSCAQSLALLHTDSEQLVYYNTT